MAYQPSSYVDAYPPSARSLSRNPSFGYPSSNYGHETYHTAFPHMPPAEYQPQFQLYGPPMPITATPSGASGRTPMMRRQKSSGPERRESNRDPYYDPRTSIYYNQTPVSVTNQQQIPPRRRRRSSVSFAASPTVIEPSASRMGGTYVRFKRKGAYGTGITLEEAQGRLQFSSKDVYPFSDMHADGRRRIILKVKWLGLPSAKYDIPVDNVEGRVSLSSLARRVSRACVHYIEANRIPVQERHVVLHRLVETSAGVWEPVIFQR